MWLCIIVSLSIHDLWFWTFDLDTETIVFVYFQLVLKPAFRKLYSNSLPHNVVQHGILKHPWALTWVWWAWPWNVCLCQFWSCIKASIMKMDEIAYNHIKVCINFDLVLWPSHWKACSYWLSIIKASILKMDNAIHYHIY